MTDAQREYQSLSQYIRALCRQLRSRKRDDIARRPAIREQIEAARQKRDRLPI